MNTMNAIQMNGQMHLENLELHKIKSVYLLQDLTEPLIYKYALWISKKEGC